MSAVMSGSAPVYPRTIAFAAIEWDRMRSGERLAVVALTQRVELFPSNRLPRWIDLEGEQRVAVLFGLRQLAALGGRVTRGMGIQ